jgi:hydrogenase maturation protease
MGRRTVVIGVGNVILGDDGVGWRVADAVDRGLGQRPDVVVIRVGTGGLTLMELMEGFDRTVVIDAMHTGSVPEGTVRVFPLSALPEAGTSPLRSSHDVSLGAALEVGRCLGTRLPPEVTVVAVETTPDFHFSDHLTPLVAAAVPAAAQAVLAAITSEETGHGVT